MMVHKAFYLHANVSLIPFPDIIHLKTFLQDAAAALLLVFIFLFVNIEYAYNLYTVPIVNSKNIA